MKMFFLLSVTKSLNSVYLLLKFFDMVYIFFYEVSPFRYYSICPTLQYALNLVSYFAGDLGYHCDILPYNPLPYSLEDFKSVISGVYDPKFCDLTRQDILAFEFQFNVSLLITDLYE